MFGLVAQVSLYDKYTVAKKYVFRYDETEQYGEKSNSGRIVFHTTHQSIRANFLVAQVDLYNLDEKVWDWISTHGGNWQNGNLQSNLYLKLEVGWSNFGNHSPLYTLFDGNVNSFYVSREGRDNVFHFYCGMLPKIDNSTPLKITPRTPQSSTKNRYGDTRENIIKEKFLAVLVQTNYVFDQMGIQQSFVDGFAWLSQQVMFGKVFLRLDFPMYDVFGNEVGVEDSELKQYLEEKINKSIGTSGDAVRNLNDYLAAEGIMNLGYYMEPTTYGPDGVAQSPTFVLKLRLAKRRTVDSGTRVPEKNIIVNYEMLTQEPVVTPYGIQLHSLMRPWLDVEDVIKLEIITNKSDLDGSQVNNPAYARPETAYTVNISNRSSYYMAAWGQTTSVFDANAEALKQDKDKRGIFNVPFQVQKIQHIGDTHGKNWHSLIETYQPGLIFGV